MAPLSQGEGLGVQAGVTQSAVPAAASNPSRNSSGIPDTVATAYTEPASPASGCRGWPQADPHTADPETADPDTVLEAAHATRVPAHVIGTVGGVALTLQDAGAISVNALRAMNEAWLPDYMAQA